MEKFKEQRKLELELNNRTGASIEAKISNEINNMTKFRERTRKVESLDPIKEWYQSSHDID